MAFRHIARLLLLVLLAARPAWAQSPVERETARQLMHDGYTMAAKGQNAAALDAFRRAHAIMNVPTTGIELGRSLAAAGKIIEARDVLWRVARMKDSPDEPPVYRAAKEDARALTESLAQRLASLRIVPREQGYRILLDGAEISAALIGVATKVDPGEHVIVAEYGGRKSEVRVTVAESETKDVAIGVQAAAPLADAGGRAPREGVAMGGTGTRGRRGPSALVWAGAIGAATSLIVGGVTGGVAIARKSDASEYCQGNRCLSAADDSLSSARTFAGISTGAFVVGGVLALATGIVYFLVEKPDPQ